MSILKGGKEFFEFTRVGLDNDVKMLSGSGVPVDGTSGTGAGIAGPGSLYTRYDAAAKLYINTGTKASPTWIVVGTQV